MLKEYFAPKLLRNPWTRCALAGIHLIHFREQKLCCRICSSHLVGCRFPHQASSVSWNLRSEWHLSTNLAMQIVNCAPWSPTLQCRHGCMSPSCGKGRMHSGGEHEWQIQRPHLRQWCFLKQSTVPAHLVDPSKKRQTIYLTQHGVKMMIGHESKKYYRPHAAWRGRNNPFCHPFCPPSLQLLKSNQKSAWHIWHNCSWGCRSAMRSQSSNMKENVTISSAYISSTVPRTIWFVRLLKILKRHAVLSPEPPKIQASHSLTRPFCKKPSD